MRITVETRGPTFDRLIAATNRDLRTANRAVGREIVKVGRRTIRQQAPRLFGRRLRVRARNNPHPFGAEVSFRGNPARAWAAAKSGVQPWIVTGGWSARAGGQIEAAVTPTVADTYDEALT